MDYTWYVGFRPIVVCIARCPPREDNLTYSEYQAVTETMKEDNVHGK